MTRRGALARLVAALAMPFGASRAAAPDVVRPAAGGWVLRPDDR
jgi:hypothetical protein